MHTATPAAINFIVSLACLIVNMLPKQPSVGFVSRIGIVPLALTFLFSIGSLHFAYSCTSEKASGCLLRRLLEAPKLHGVSLTITPSAGRGNVVDFTDGKQECCVVSNRHKHFESLLNTQLCHQLKERGEKSSYLQCSTNALIPQGSELVTQPGGVCIPTSSPQELIAGVSTGLPCSDHGCCQVPTFLRKGTMDCKVFEQVFTHHFYKMLYPVAKQFFPKYILDAGGNAGFSTMMFKLLWPDAVVVGLEPDPGNFEIYQLNTAAFSGVFALRAGLWGHTSHLAHVKAMNETWGKVFTDVNTGNQSAIDAYSVDDVAAMFDIPYFDFVKLDVEGAEGRIFQVGEDLSWLDAAQLIVMEIHEDFKRFFGLEEISLRISEALSERQQLLTVVEEGEHLFVFTKKMLETVKL